MVESITKNECEPFVKNILINIAREYIQSGSLDNPEILLDLPPVGTGFLKYVISYFKKVENSSELTKFRTVRHRWSEINDVAFELWGSYIYK